MSRPDGNVRTTGRIVLHVADVAGVAAALVEAVDTHTDWHAEQVALPSMGASSGRVAHAAGQVIRAGLIPRRVSRAAATSGAHVVHLHWARCAPLLVRQDRPLVVHVHGSDVRDRRGPTADAVQRAIGRASAVLVSTPDLTDHVDTPSTYLPNPVRVDTFVPADGCAHGDAPESGRAPVILLFARLSEVKGADVLIETARQIRRLEPTVRVIGLSGGEADHEAVAAGVELLPPLSRQGVVELLQQTDVVIGQQGVGTLGLSELEAMSCERPVIVPIRAELYPADIPVEAVHERSQVAQAALDLLHDRTRAQRLGERARQYVIEHHSYGAVAAQLSSVYELVADG